MRTILEERERRVSAWKIFRPHIRSSFKKKGFWDLIY